MQDLCITDFSHRQKRCNKIIRLKCNCKKTNQIPYHLCSLDSTTTIILKFQIDQHYHLWKALYYPFRYIEINLHVNGHTTLVFLFPLKMNAMYYSIQYHILLAQSTD